MTQTVWVGRDNEQIWQLTVDGTVQDLVVDLALSRVVLEIGGPSGLVVDSAAQAAIFDIGVTVATKLSVQLGLATGIASWLGAHDCTLTVYSGAWPNGLIWSRSLSVEVRQD